MMKKDFDTIEEAIKRIRKGEIIIVVDDESRENEGDFICASQKITPEIINFMSKYGRGLICCSLEEDRCDSLGLNLMVGKNTDSHNTSFTVSVDLIGKGVSTGISAKDRSKTIKALVDNKTKTSDLSKPGHVFPLKSINGGVLRRAGHTEASVDFAKLAGLKASGVLVEILNDDGSMARVPDLKKVSQKHNICLVSIKDLISYRLKNESLIKKEIEVNLPTGFGDFKLVAFTQINTEDVHLALIKGKWKKNESILVRVHSSCVTGDIFHSLKCDCGDQLNESMKIINNEGKGVVLYMNQEGRGIGFINKLKAYKLQENGLDTVQANKKLGFKSDQRDYGIGAQILRYINISKIKLLTNNPKKRIGLIGYGLEIIKNIPIECNPNKHNIKYLRTKRDKMGHKILIDKK
mgnify:FL=1